MFPVIINKNRAKDLEAFLVDSVYIIL